MHCVPNELSHEWLHNSTQYSLAASLQSSSALASALYRGFIGMFHDGKAPGDICKLQVEGVAAGDEWRMTAECMMWYAVCWVQHVMVGHSNPAAAAPTLHATFLLFHS